MKIFITGGTGFIGSAVIKELIAHGHNIAGLARSEASKARLAELGATAIDGTIENFDSLKRGAMSADAVIHCAFIHNFANFAAACETDKLAVEAIGDSLVGTNKPFIVTSGVPVSLSGKEVTENDDSDGPTPRRSEQAALPFTERGVDVRIVRPSRFVYDKTLKGGFISAIIGIAAQKGVSAYVGNGANHIHAVNVLDLAILYHLALEKGKSGAKYQGVGEGAIAFRDVAEAVAKRLTVPARSITPEKAAEHFGFLGAIVGAENPASNKITKTTLDWKPTHHSLLEILAI